jgi:hypothetical protein
MKIGYIRISSVSQRPKLQHDALEAFGCRRLYADISVEDKREQPELTRMLGQLKSGDLVVICQLDRLCHSRRRLFQIIDLLEAKGVDLVSIEDNLDTTAPGGMESLRAFLRWSLNEAIPSGTALVFLRVDGFGDVRIERCKTGIDELDQIIEAGAKLTGCDPEESYPGLDSAACLIGAFGGEILRVEYGPLPRSS